MSAQINIFQAENIEKPYSFAEHSENRKRLYSGGFTTAAEIQAIYKRIKASESILKAELNAKTIKELAPNGVRSGMKKADIVDSIYSRLFSLLWLSDSFTWSPFSETIEQARDRVIGGLTDEKVIAFNESLKAEKSEREKVLNNPETLAEFRELVRLRGESALTPEQKIKFDELQAEQEKEIKARELAEKAKIEAVQAEKLAGVSFKLVESVHTKKNVPLWVVQLSDRVERETYNELNHKAKQLGGWFSSFNKACSGFHFWEKDQAEKFIDCASGQAVSRLDHLLEKQEQKKDNAADRLRSVAAGLREKAEESMSRDRLTNTVRRVGMAASAEADARADLFMADTMDNLADAIETGEARHLSGIKYKTHVETLHRLAQNARNEADRAAGIQWEKTKERAPVLADIENVQYPYPQVYKTNLVEAIRFLSSKKGAMRLSQKFERWINAVRTEYVTFRYSAEIEDLIDLIGKMKENGADKWHVERLADTMENHKRLQDMGITSAPELRAALREFLRYRGEARKADPIKAMERELIGQKIPGYFPTPSAVVDRVLELANIKPGQYVLEPSAGKGNIADGVRAAVPEAKIDVLEINHTLREILRAKNYNIASHVGDFLEFSVIPSESYHRIVMNPPFENLQDVDHVRHAYECLKDGGRLVAIMSESPFFRSDSKAVGFRAWLDAVGGYSEQLPAGSFLDSERSTGVNTRIVVINK